MLHKDYYRKGSVEKKNLVVSLKGLEAKTGLIGGKPPVVKYL
jgi:hypothetical protein